MLGDLLFWPPAQTVSYTWGTYKLWFLVSMWTPGRPELTASPFSGLPGARLLEVKLDHKHSGLLAFMTQEHGLWPTRPNLGLSTSHSQGHPSPQTVGKGLETGFWKPSGQNPFLDDQEGTRLSGKAELILAALHV